eukprot:scaffold5291_cov240-Pinguiococcus_pyrenoidosus.AAC.1
MWGRRYKTSKHQWLPTYFTVSRVGKVTIEGRVNGIDREAHPEMYSKLAMLFERALPLSEHAWTYGICIRFVHPVYLDAPDKAPRDLRVP